MSLVSTTKFVTVAYIFAEGRAALNVEEMVNAFKDAVAKADAEVREDQDTLAPDVIAFLLENPGLNSLSLDALVRAVHSKRLEEGKYAGKDHKAKEAAYDRLAEILPEYIRANPEMFHHGRGRKGVAIHFVPGEVMTDEKTGETLRNAAGEDVQKYRINAEEWAKITAPKASDEAPASGTATTKAA